MRRIALVVVGFVALCTATLGLLPGQLVRAAGPVVTTCSDAVVHMGTSLRDAIGSAGSGDTITFQAGLNCSGGNAITLAQGTLTLGTNNLTIDGSNATIMVDGGCTFSGGACQAGTGVRVFMVNSGVTAGITALTIQHGSGPDCGGVTCGGGIYNFSGTLSVTNTTIVNNSAGSGGGIENFGTLMVSNSTFSGNSSGEGGAIENFASMLTVTNSTFSGNSVTNNGAGGAIFSTSNQPTPNATLIVTNSTFSGNSASGTFGVGGGISNVGAPLTVTNATFSGNTAGFGGGIEIEQGGTATLTNTIVEQSTGGDCNAFDSDSTFTVGSDTLADDNTCGSATQKTSAQVNLLPLGNYGGPTQTFNLGPSSAAIDTGTNSGCPGTDQRGVPRPINGTCDVGAVESYTATTQVNNTGDGAADLARCVAGNANTCRLRDAIAVVNGGFASGSITFSIPGIGAHTIAPTSPLPTLTAPVTINGYTQSGASANTLATGDNAVILIELDGENAGSGANGFTVSTGAGGSVIKGLAIGRFKHTGIEVDGVAATVAGNFIGTDATGMSARANGNGVLIQNAASGVTVGGTTAAARNLISGNTLFGVAIIGSGTTSNVIEGNYIGTAATGTAALGNGGASVYISNGASGNTVGGTTPDARNVISGNGSDGVSIPGSGASNNVIEGNYIGTNAAGTAALANAGYGIEILDGATNNTVGGTAAGAGNVISGNVQSGVVIAGSGTTNTTVTGNQIGMNAAGTGAIANGGTGVLINGASGNTVGGTTAAARNVISGNASIGVQIGGSGATSNVIEGNYIGTNAAGSAAIANGASGVSVSGGATNNTVGGTAAGASNVISGNASSGVSIIGSGTTGNVIAGNYIGTNAAGSAAIANGINGVRIIGGASGNTVGGTAAGAGNTVAFNGHGVVIGANASDTGTVTNAVLGNSIHDNGGTTGLDLGNDGVTANGANPRSFPNDGQNYPVLIAAYGSTVTGTLDSIATTTFRVEFFATPSGATGGRNGQTFLGALDPVTTNGSGHVAFTFTALSALPAGTVITATATNTMAGAQHNDTSEFSAPVTIAAAITPTAGTPQSALINHAFATALTAKVTDGTGAGLANIPVTFTAPVTGASGTFATTGTSCTVASGGASATCVTDANGNATAPAYTANVTAGADTVVASVPGVAATANFALTNLELVRVSPTSLPGGVKGMAYSQMLTASGGTGSGFIFTLTGGAPPTGLTLSTAGVLSGTPMATGSFTFTVQAQDAQGNTGSQQFTVTITAAPLVSIAVTPANPTLKVGQAQQFTATGTYADNSTADLTSAVTWTSDAASVASVGTSGKGTGASPGTAHITATQGSVSGQTSVTVTGGTSVGVAPAPQPATRPGSAGATPPAPGGTGRSGTSGGSAPAPAPTGR